MTMSCSLTHFKWCSFVLGRFRLRNLAKDVELGDTVVQGSTQEAGYAIRFAFSKAAVRLLPSHSAARNVIAASKKLSVVFHCDLRS